MGRYNKKIIEEQKNERIGEERLNNQGCPMKIVEYKDSHNITIEFQDEYKERVYSNYSDFVKGRIKNPYHPTVCGVGITGNKYSIRINGKIIKEYTAWHNMLLRCFSEEYKEKEQTYENVTCCKEWLLFENFYKWLHEQENFDKWFNGDRWSVDKDILMKGNKIYKPNLCCLVPQGVNSLFAKGDSVRGDFPIGVCKGWNGKFQAFCQNPLTNKQENLGHYLTLEEAFFVYKKRKEEIIKQIAEIEYNKGNITKQCYQSMMKYEVEVTD